MRLVPLLWSCTACSGPTSAADCSRCDRSTTKSPAARPARTAAAGAGCRRRQSPRAPGSSVAGVTMRCRRAWRGSSRVRADKIARSGHEGRGVPIWRRRTETSWRSTRIELHVRDIRDGPVARPCSPRSAPHAPITPARLRSGQRCGRQPKTIDSSLGARDDESQSTACHERGTRMP